MNKVMLIGHVGTEPEVVSFDANTQKARLRLATTEKWKDNNGVSQSKTQWHNLVFWGNVVDTIKKYVDKGKLMYIEGRLEYRTYTDKNNVERFISEVIVKDFEFLSKSTSKYKAKKIQTEDDLPF